MKFYVQDNQETSERIVRSDTLLVGSGKRHSIDVSQDFNDHDRHVAWGSLRSSLNILVPVEVYDNLRLGDRSIFLGDVLLCSISRREIQALKNSGVPIHPWGFFSYAVMGSLQPTETQSCPR